MGKAQLGVQFKGKTIEGQMEIWIEQTNKKACTHPKPT
jgi:hypothetical protein